MMHSENYKSFRVAVNVFVVRDGKILLGMRKNVFGAGGWALPGGHMEDKEAMVDTAARELKEETAMEVEKLEFNNIVNHISRETHYVHVGFEAKGVKGEPIVAEPDRCEEWKWFDLDELPEDLLWCHVKSIELYKAREKFADD